MSDECSAQLQAETECYQYRDAQGLDDAYVSTSSLLLRRSLCSTPTNEQPAVQQLQPTLPPPQNTLLS